MQFLLNSYRLRFSWINKYFLKKKKNKRTIQHTHFHDTLDIYNKTWAYKTHIKDNVQ